MPNSWATVIVENLRITMQRFRPWYFNPTTVTGHDATMRANSEGGWVRYEDATEDIERVRASFKNFHRLLCERFNYEHDEKDWERDQLSLIEHIASLK
jgi:hypothetical protein